MKSIDAIAIPFAIILGLAGCGSVVPQPADPEVTARIVAACTADGVFKNLGGRLVLSMVPVPGVATADQLIASGVDLVCANPAAFSADLSTAAWVVHNIHRTSAVNR